MTEPIQPDKIRISNGKGLLSVIPLILGFHPTDSVVLACIGDDNIMGPVLRVDLDLLRADPKELAGNLASNVQRHASRCILVFYGTAVDEHNFEMLLSGRGLFVFDVVFTDNEPYEPHKELHAEYVGSGRVLAGNREELRARVEYNGGAERAGPNQAILAAMRNVKSRDDFIAVTVDKARDVLPLVLQTCRRIPDHEDSAANTCAVAGLLAYRLGDGAFTQVCLDRALRIDANHRLSHMLIMAISAAITPDEMGVLAQDPAS